MADDILDPDVDILLNSVADIEDEEETEEDTTKKKKPVTPAKKSQGRQKKTMVLNTPQQVMSTAIAPGSPLQKQIISPLDNDTLVQIVKDQASTQTILNTILNEISEEIAYLKAKREEHWGTDKDIEVTSLKRVQALQQMAEAVVKKEKLSRDRNDGKIDFYSDNFQRVLKSFLEIIKATMTKVKIPPQYLGIFFSQLAKEFDGFEKKAEKIYFGKDKT